ncbi:aldehyde dehydrogenase [Puniceicoccus vermicola]|uniref:Aldehyde dehydrogenase n=1 Tax=Puniceicoccus vermicola TaxID=388746 RepID=A0A7X1E5V1_9BACT|nr:aldehyde dehydrogenase [Puniceicoccus vermicola]MBC2603531.1 aldehyde dehydrogenase [Puniceicoccus vermicola]
MDSRAIEEIVAEVLNKMGGNSRSLAGSSKPATPTPAIKKATAGNRKGVFPDADSAVEAARGGYESLRKKGFAARAKVIEIVKAMCSAKAEEWGKIELEETGIGRLDHKIEKLQILSKVPGVEWLKPYGMSGDMGISMEENAPFGVIATITPVTHSIPTLSGNIVNMVAAGNAMVINAHPGGAKCAAMAVDAFNREIEREVGIENLVTIIEEPSLESFNALCASSGIDLICVTGGPGVVAAAMKSGKRAICAGPGNPPVVVDVSADLDKAATDIITGGAYDNNLLCIGEKQVFILEPVFDDFVAAFKRAGGHQLNAKQLETLTNEAFTNSKDAGGCSHPVLNRKLVGASPEMLASHCGARVAAGTPMLFAETDAAHLFVQKEQMMPMIPLVRVRDMDQAIKLSVQSEHGYHHSAMIHTSHVGHMTRMGQAMNSSIFVKNGPCTAGLGLGGEGYLSYSIATTTGEGITTPQTFTRRRRCVLVDALNVVG